MARLLLANNEALMNMLRSRSAAQRNTITAQLPKSLLLAGAFKVQYYYNGGFFVWKEDTEGQSGKVRSWIVMMALRRQVI